MYVMSDLTFIYYVSLLYSPSRRILLYVCVPKLFLKLLFLAYVTIYALCHTNEQIFGTLFSSPIYKAFTCLGPLSTLHSVLLLKSYLNIN